MPDKIQFRRDTAANWQTYNPTLAAGEPGYETSARLFKVGDGVTSWNTLPYANLPNPALAGGRLCVFQGVPVNPNAAYFHSTPPTILYYTPYTSNLITLWSHGIGWRTRAFDNSTAVSLVGLPGNTNYDVFASDVNGSVQLSLVPWANNWTRVVLPGCGVSGIVLFQGVMVQCGNAANRYLGTIRTSPAGGSTLDTMWSRFVYNYTNQVLTTALWYHDRVHTYATGYWRQWDNGSFSSALQEAQGANKLRVVTGVPTNIFLKLNTYMRYGATALMAYTFETQRPANIGPWNNIAPNGDFNGYGFDLINAVDPAPLGGAAVFTMNSSGTYIRPTVGLGEFWVAEYGYNSNSWFVSTSISVDIMM